ncbi:hypothetical protein KFL_010430060 [Klebsormidium nitens]|uniref:KilA-N domain-containing protein n=1 Tax=Klebsormidium nitens TaxID=105231 RepID=A0A1Y1IT95_KLENI|nr:hypothetical protein KFL_010430060 [Klebsormidium nitens]|eukprot:GAQ92541.1 hypothetical protein KFL_010430060 [Klebsormidium nitens]
MAPPARPILAIRADGSTTRYPNIRAAVDATGIARGSIALAASKLGIRDARVWKYEDDPRAPDLSVLRTAPRNDTPLDDDERERAAAFVEALRGDDGRMITEMRLSDGYICATNLCQLAGKTWGHYYSLDGTKAFIEALSKLIRTPSPFLIIKIQTGPLKNRGTFVHPTIATHLATWISPSFAARVTTWIEEAKERIPNLRGDYNNALATLKPESTSRGNMRIMYYLPEIQTHDQVFESFAQQRPNVIICTDISQLRDKLVKELQSELSDAIILVMCAHGDRLTGTVHRPQGPLTGQVFYDGIVAPPGGTTPWPGLRTILEDRKNNKETRFYFLAAQCYGLYFTRAMTNASMPNASILGLSSGKTWVEGEDMGTRHMETEAHINFIQEIEARYP